MFDPQKRQFLLLFLAAVRNEAVHLVLLLKVFLVIEITVWMEMQRGLVCELIDFEVCVSWRGSSLIILPSIRCHYTQFSGVATRIERSE